MRELGRQSAADFNQQFRTSLKRTLHFGPYELLQASDKQVFGFRGSANSRTRGLFTEPNGIVPMSSLGVVTDRLAEKVPLRRDTFAPVARLTEESPSIKPSTCLSREVLGDDVKTLLVQRVGPRCVGLQIEHDKSQIVTLGQWDPDSQFTSVLYDEDSGVSLCALYFIYSKDAPGQRYVADIRLEAPETGADSGPSTETVPTVDAGAVSRTDAGVDEDANTGTESGTDTGAWSDPSCFAWTTLDKVSAQPFPYFSGRY